MHAFPLFSLRPLPWQGPDPAEIDALLIGSANAVRLGGAELERYRGKVAHAVGRVTAQACIRGGFARGMVGQGGMQRLLDALPPGPLRLLRVAARDHVELERPLGKLIELRIAYERLVHPMPEDMAAILREGALVLLYSAGGARHLAAECDRLGIDRGKVRLAALGSRIAEAAGEGWEAVRFPPQIAPEALLALALDMCH